MFFVHHAQRDEVTGDGGKIQARARGHDDRAFQRPSGDAEVSGDVVCLLPDHQLLRSVSDGTYCRARSYVSGGLSYGRYCGFYGLWTGKPEQQHLEGSALGNDREGSHRRTCLRLADGGNLRLALAAVNGIDSGHRLH